MYEAGLGGDLRVAGEDLRGSDAKAFLTLLEMLNATFKRRDTHGDWDEVGDQSSQ